MINRVAQGDIGDDSPLMKELSDFFAQLFRDPSTAGSADYASVSEGYFRSLGIPLLRGRLFDDRDAMDAPHVAVISQSLVREKWPMKIPSVAPSNLATWMATRVC